MKAFWTVVFVTAALAPSLAAAQAVNINQNDFANVAAVVQAGPNSGPVVIRQTGRFNISGVVQAGRTNTVTIYQTGWRNNVSLGQIGGRNRSLIVQRGRGRRR